MFSGKKIKELEEQIQSLQTELADSRQVIVQKEQSLAATQADLQQCNASLNACTQSHTEYVQKFAPITNIEAEVRLKQQEVENGQIAIATLNGKYHDALTHYEALQKEVAIYEDKLEIGSFGLYKFQYDFDSSEKFKQAIDANYEEQKQLIKEEKAITCTTEWSVGGSKVEGKKMTVQYSKLMLFAFNGECDSLIAKVKWNNAEKTKERIQKAFEAVNKLGASHSISITPQFLHLKLQELALVYEYEQKKQEEKEEQRRIREQMREEEKAQREFERAQRDAEDEENMYEKQLNGLRKNCLLLERKMKL